MGIQNTTLDDIAAVIGFTATLKLAAWFGNDNNLWVPAAVGPDNTLARLLGLPLAKRLSDAFPDEHLAVPRLTAYDDELRRCRVATLLARGLSTRQTAAFERISERRVQQICYSLEVEGVIAPVGPETDPDVMDDGPMMRVDGRWKRAREKPEGKNEGAKALEKAVGKMTGRKTPEKAGSKK